MNPKLNGWAISEEMFNHIRSFLPEGKTILELGSGTGTEVLLQHYNVISVEHNVKWAFHRDGKYHHTMIYAPLKGEDPWYSIENDHVTYNFEGVDLLIIDGPPNIHRQNILLSPWLESFVEVIDDIIVDDTHRHSDHKIARFIIDEYGYEFFHTGCSEDKNFMHLKKIK